MEAFISSQNDFITKNHFLLLTSFSDLLFTAGISHGLYLGYQGGAAKTSSWLLLKMEVGQLIHLNREFLKHWKAVQGIGGQMSTTLTFTTEPRELRKMWKSASAFNLAIHLWFTLLSLCSHLSDSSSLHSYSYT